MHGVCRGHLLWCTVFPVGGVYFVEFRGSLKSSCWCGDVHVARIAALSESEAVRYDGLSP